MNKFVKITKAFSGLIIVITLLVVTLTAFLVGYVRGYGIGWNGAAAQLQKYLSDKVSSTTAPQATGEPATILVPKPTPPNWSGPELWDAINKARVANGVNPLQLKDNLCTIASIRLNELLELGKLDGHVGFSQLETRPDIKPIFESYSTVSEFLVSGAASATDAVNLWLNTLGHKELLIGGQYVWGCAYAQNGFGVAIAAY